jgi:hypothetical protein
MSAEERQRLEALADQRAHLSPDAFDACDENVMDFENILTGAHLIDISHAGGEFQDLAREIFGDFWTPSV